MPDWAWRQCPRCGRTAYVPAGAYCTFHVNQRFQMQATSSKGPSS